MTKKRKKASRTNAASLRSTLALMAVVALLVSAAYSTCTKDCRPVDSPAGVDSNLAALTNVVTSPADDAQMLHYPGFDVCFSNNHRQPYYVSWILTPEHVAASEYKRTNNFRADPDVENSPQLSDYRRSGYDRGHMAPSADFQYSREAQDATFFLTNISPQSNALNSGAWNRLEEQCRAWAMRDSSLVIITGPVLTDYLTETIGENRITVPARYFKVVFAPYANPPRAIAFVMPNHAVSGGVQQSVVTVDQLEEITGFDFFSNLPDELEERIESESRYSQWQYPARK